MSFKEYVSSKMISICMIGIGSLYFILISYLCEIPFRVAAVFLAGVFLVLVIYLAFSWHSADKRLKELHRIINKLPEKYLLGEIMDRPENAVEREYFLIMKEISRSAIEAVVTAGEEKQDYCEYVERWVHEIKTPLTAAGLILANGGDAGKLRGELRRADNMAETILAYARLRTAQKDTQIHKTELKKVCGQAVREEMELLIAAQISIEINGDSTIYTDPKSIAFIIKQLLINCAKYCPGCKILIYIEENVLVFEDNGPGIPSYELSRVTDRGFTGEAFRTKNQSTGMGLYIVKELCRQLNVELDITSHEEEFTRFTFRFLS